MRYRLSLSSLVVALALVFTAPLRAEELVILHTNDTHSNLFPFGPQKEHGGIARMSTLIKQLRTENDHVLALHGGDVFVGTFAFNKYLGYPELKIMEGLYDAMALGNHELDLGTGALTAILAGINPLTAQSMGSPVTLPILSANINLSGLPGLQPFIRGALIKDVGGIKVGLLGVITNDPVYYPPGVSAILDDPYEAAGVTAAGLRAAGCKVVIAVSHLGKASDLLVLSKVPGIDVIVGSHSHDQIRADPDNEDNGKVNGKIIVQAGEFGELLGELRIDVDATEGITLKSHTLHAIDRDIRDDPELIPYLNALRDGIYNDPRYGPVLSRHVASAEWDHEKSWMVPDLHRAPSHRDTPLGNLVTDAIRTGVARAGYAVDCALEVVDLLGNKIYEGKVVGNDVMLSVPYGFDPVSGLGFKIKIVSLFGAELLGGLEYTLNVVEYADDASPQVSGLTFQYDSRRDPGTRIDPASPKINGIPINPGGLYRVALNERLVALLASLGLDLTGRVEETGLFEFDLVETYMNELNKLRYTSEGRIIDEAALP